MKLYIIRHAWAGERGDPRWPDDSLRPLTDDGRKRFAKTAKRLAKRGLQPARIATSPLVRCRQTADLLSAATGGVEVVELDALRPGSDLDAILEWTSAQVGDIACVGHSPDVESLLAALVDCEAENVRFAKGASAALSFDAPPAPGEGTLLWHATAKILGA